jgi:hypothetical protein
MLHFNTGNETFMDYANARSAIDTMGKAKNWSDTDKYQNMIAMLETMITDGLLPAMTLTILMDNLQHMD